MIARDMRVGRQYKLLRDAAKGRAHVVEYDRPSGNGGEFAIVHERGELDMQSCFGIPWTEEVEEMPDVVNENKCPGCGNKLGVIPRNHPNHVCRRHNAICDCGWMGDYVFVDY
jgi:hypothetical protein